MHNNYNATGGLTWEWGFCDSERREELNVWVTEVSELEHGILANLERADPWTSCPKSMDFSRNPIAFLPMLRNPHPKKVRLLSKYVPDNDDFSTDQ